MSIGSSLPVNRNKDQYEDGVAPSYWDLYIGDKSKRIAIYKDFLLSHLKENGCKRVLDAATGTGIDSEMLVEEGFHVTSIDLSDKMLSYALATRWKRKEEQNFNNWEIKQADWLNLSEDLKGHDLFDAIICIGNSYAHVENDDGTQTNQKKGMRNFEKLLNPGGILIIDHRNYDYVLQHGKTPLHTVYYNGDLVESMKTYILYHEKRPILISLDYTMKPLPHFDEKNKDKDCETCKQTLARNPKTKFLTTCFPHEVESFKQLLKFTFGPSAKYSLFGDYKPLREVEDPSFYIHVVKKTAKNNSLP